MVEGFKIEYGEYPRILDEMLVSEHGGAKTSLPSCYPPHSILLALSLYCPQRQSYTEWNMVLPLTCHYLMD